MEWVGLRVFGGLEVFAGMHHGNDEVVDVASKVDVFKMPVGVPLGDVDGVVVHLVDAGGGGGISTPVAVSVGLGRDAIGYVLLRGVAFDLATGNGFGILGNDAGKQVLDEVTMFLHLPWLAERTCAMVFLQSADGQ